MYSIWQTHLCESEAEIARVLEMYPAQAFDQVYLKHKKHLISQPDQIIKIQYH